MRDQSLRCSSHHKSVFVSIYLLLILALLTLASCRDAKRQQPIPLGKSSVAHETATVGSILVLSGPNAHYGEDTKAGMEIGLAHVNATGIKYTDPSGNSHNYKLEIEFRNSHGGPNNTINAPEQMQSLIADGRPAVLGAFFSGITLSLAPIANDRKVVLLTPCSTNYKLREQGEWVFRILPTDYDQAIRMADYGRTVLKADNAAVMYIDNSYGKDLATAFIGQFQSNGGQIIFNRNFSEGTKEFGGFVNALLSSKAQFLFLVGHTQEMIDILRTKHKAENRSNEPPLPVLGTDGMYDDAFVKGAGEAAEGIILASAGFNPRSDAPVVKKFVADFKEKFGRDPNLWSAGGYDSVLVIAEAIRTGGMTPVGIRNGLTDIKELAGATGDNSVDPSGGMAHKPVYTFLIQDGEFERVKTTASDEHRDAA